MLVEQALDVIDVRVLGDYRLRLSFADGTVGDVDFSGRQWHGGSNPPCSTSIPELEIGTQ
jgi:hypothetical protein